MQLFTGRTILTILKKLKNIVKALSGSRLPVVLPLHPRTKGILKKHDIILDYPIVPIDPVGYIDMICLEKKNSYKIITDSGGVQKEAYFFEKNCIILR